MALAKKARMLVDFVLSYVLPNYKYDYWHCPHIHSNLIEKGDYFIDFTPKTYYPGPFDQNGIPFINLATQHWAKNSLVTYSPIVISQYALGWYSRYLKERSGSALQVFLKVADWLLDYARDSQSKKGQITALYTNYGNGEVLSGMAQGLAISVWCRAFKVTGKDQYLTKAVQAFNVLVLEIGDGGVVDSFNGIPVLEEWTDDRIHILNGHLFAFAGIVDLLQTDNDDKALQDVLNNQYNRHLGSSILLIKLADMGFWTRYSFRRTCFPNIASFFYHSLHIEMLKGLSILTKNKEFEVYAEKWHHQRRQPIFRTTAVLLKLADRAEIELRTLISRVF